MERRGSSIQNKKNLSQKREIIMRGILSNNHLFWQPHNGEKSPLWIAGD